jgi:hypothetical protein
MLAFALLLASCANHYHPNTAAVGSPIPVENLKIKRMAPISYSYESTNVGCSEIEFLKKYVGKKIKLEDGTVLRIDNIMELHKDVHSQSMQVNEKFSCSFWGLAVEYEK